MKASDIIKARGISEQWDEAKAAMIGLEKIPPFEAQMLVNGRFFCLTEVEASEAMDRIMADIKYEAAKIGLELD